MQNEKKQQKTENIKKTTENTSYTQDDVRVQVWFNCCLKFSFTFF